jgi:hypothetical protein
VRKRLLGGLLAVGLIAALPGVALADGPPTSVSGVCFAGDDRVAIPIPSDETTGGRAPSVWFGSEYVGPFGIAPFSVFARTGACEFTQPPG